MLLPVCLYSQVHDDCVSLDPAFPKDVATFKQKRCACYHFSSEDPYDNERREFLEEKVKMRCTGLVKLQELLLQKYQENQDILKILNDLDTTIAN